MVLNTTNSYPMCTRKDLQLPMKPHSRPLSQVSVSQYSLIVTSMGNAQKDGIYLEVHIPSTEKDHGLLDLFDMQDVFSY